MSHHSPGEHPTSRSHAASPRLVAAHVTSVGLPAAGNSSALMQDTEAVEAAVRIAARRRGGAAATVAGQPVEALVTHDSMAWAAATALSRGFNLQRQDFDGTNGHVCS